MHLRTVARILGLLLLPWFDSPPASHALIKETARLIAQQQRAAGGAARVFSEQEILMGLMRERAWRRNVAGWIRESRPDIADYLEADLGGVLASTPELRRLAAKIDAAAESATGGIPVTRNAVVASEREIVAWRPPAYRIQAGVGNRGSCRLRIAGVDAGRATLFANGARLEDLAAGGVLAGCPRALGESGSALPPGMSSALATGFYPRDIQDGRVLIRLREPEAFVSIYRRAGAPSAERCRTLGQVCLDNQGVAFTLGCDGDRELTLAFDAQQGASLSIKGRPGAIEIGLAE
jgi:hypothetical protein